VTAASHLAHRDFSSGSALKTCRTSNSPGDYYNVDPIAVTSAVDVLTRNGRRWVSIETEEFGTVLFMAIGATDVRSVH